MRAGTHCGLTSGTAIANGWDQEVRLARTLGLKQNRSALALTIIIENKVKLQTQIREIYALPKMEKYENQIPIDNALNHSSNLTWNRATLTKSA